MVLHEDWQALKCEMIHSTGKNEELETKEEF